MSAVAFLTSMGQAGLLGTIVAALTCVGTVRAADHGDTPLFEVY